MAMTLLLQVKDIEKKLKDMIKNYGSSFPYNVSSGGDSEIERKNMLNDIDLMKKQIKDKKKLSQQIINTIKKEEKEKQKLEKNDIKEQKKLDKKQPQKVDNTPIKPTWNVREQVNDIVKNRSLYIK